MPANKSEQTQPIGYLPYNPVTLPYVPKYDKEGNEIPSFWFWDRWHYWRQKGFSHSQIGLHYLVLIPEFLLHHFFVLSGSMRIYLISFFILFGGTFYAVAPTVALGSVFFFVSILISLGLANFSRVINHRVDEEDRIKQENLHNFNGKVRQKEKYGSDKEKDESKYSDIQYYAWDRIEDMEEKNGSFSWLNYKHILEKTNYTFVVYFMDIMIVIAAVWNITEEFLRWQAVLPFASTLTAMGPFWIIVTLAALAAVCLLLKMAYTHPISKLRIKNAQLLQETRDIFEEAVKKNKVLQHALNQVEEKENKKEQKTENTFNIVENIENSTTTDEHSRVLKEVKEKSATEYIFNTFNKKLAIGISLLMSAVAALGIYFLVISTSAPFWSSIVVPLFFFPFALYVSYHALKWAVITYRRAVHCQETSQKTFFTQFKDYLRSLIKNFDSEKVLEDLEIYKEAEKLKIATHWKLLASLGVSVLITICVHTALPTSLALLPTLLILTITVLTTIIYKILDLVIACYNRRQENQNIKSQEAKKNRIEIENAVAEALKERFSNEKTEKELEDLARLAYSLWKFKNMHRFKPKRDFINSLFDNIGVPLWNTAITIFPTFFIINGIFFYIFGLPSVLASWPLFVIESIPAIALAIIFGLWKLGDNEHDLIRDAAIKIFDEITNEKYGKLIPLKHLDIIPQKEDAPEPKAKPLDFSKDSNSARFTPMKGKEATPREGSKFHRHSNTKHLIT